MKDEMGEGVRHADVGGVGRTGHGNRAVKPPHYHARAGAYAGRRQQYEAPQWEAWEF